MDAMDSLKASHQMRCASTEFSKIMPTPMSSDSASKRLQDTSTARADPSQGKEQVCMAYARSVCQLSTRTLRKILIFRLILLTIVGTIVVYNVQEFIVPNPRFIFKLSELDLLYNRSFSSFFSGLSNNVAIPQGKKRPPDGIIFGVSKCGTRAILEYMKIHPDIVAANTEIDFFNNDTLYAKGIGWYLDQMPYSRAGQVTVEKSPDYFQNPDCAFRISQFRENIKLVLLLRDPVERLISQYMQLFDKNPRLPRFEQWVINPKTGFVNDYIPSVQVSSYSDHLDTWLDTFRNDQILIIESRSLREHPFEEMKRVERFLNLEPFFDPSDFYFNNTRGFFCLRYRSTGKTKCLGKSKGRQHIPVENQTIQMLKSYYQPYNKRLNLLLGFSFPWSS